MITIKGTKFGLSLSSPYVTQNEQIFTHLSLTDHHFKHDLLTVFDQFNFSVQVVQSKKSADRP
jgi:hypothetical protein